MDYVYLGLAILEAYFAFNIGYGIAALKTSLNNKE